MSKHKDIELKLNELLRTTSAKDQTEYFNQILPDLKRAAIRFDLYFEQEHYTQKEKDLLQEVKDLVSLKQYESAARHKSLLRNLQQKAKEARELFPDDVPCCLIDAKGFARCLIYHEQYSQILNLLALV